MEALKASVAAAKGDDNPPNTADQHQPSVASVGISGKAELCHESGRETRAGDQAEAPILETDGVLELGEQREDRAETDGDRAAAGACSKKGSSGAARRRTGAAPIAQVE